jgi:hypothetical protein
MRCQKEEALLDLILDAVDCWCGGLRKVRGLAENSSDALQTPSSVQLNSFCPFLLAFGAMTKRKAVVGRIGSAGDRSFWHKSLADWQ